MFETSKLRKLKYWDKIFKQLKDREIQIRSGIEESFYRSIILYIEDIGEFEKKGMMKKRSLSKNTWYDWLMNYTPKPIKNGVKDRSIFFSKQTQPNINVK